MNDYQHTQPGTLIRVLLALMVVVMGCVTITITQRVLRAQDTLADYDTIWSGKNHNSPSTLAN